MQGTGSYFSGLQAGYNHMYPSRFVLGIEAEVSFPNTIGGTRAFAAPFVGQASIEEKVQFFGMVRGRVGYAPGHWLVYATGGLAWSYSQISRTQLAGIPAGGTAAPGTVEDIFMVPRTGIAAGGGVEFALQSNWIARL